MWNLWLLHRQLSILRWAPQEAKSIKFVEMKWKQMESWNLLVLLNGPKRTRPHAIQQFNFDLISALPNGRNQSKWMLTADAAPRQTAIQDELRIVCCGVFDGFADGFSLVGVMGGGTANGSAKKRKQANQQIQIKRINQKRVNWRQLVFDLMKWSGIKEKKASSQWTGPQGADAPR